MAEKTEMRAVENEGVYDRKRELKRRYHKMAEKTEMRAVENEGVYDRKRELKAFDETKAGVKGLIDGGIEKVPSIFNRAKLGIKGTAGADLSQLSIPVIDFQGIQTSPTRRSEVIRAVRDACKKWGFFLVTNHGIPVSLLDEMVQAIRNFHELDAQTKREYYSRDLGGRKFVYNSNFDLYEAPIANWRDTVGFTMGIQPPTREEVPDVCRDVVIEYHKQVRQLGIAIYELLAEALGLKTSYFEEMGFAEDQVILGHYYPPCPEPDLTLGATSHSDPDFMTILLQDGIGGLQILHENQWVDVSPLYGAFVVNIGDLLQVISNDTITSANHRVVNKREGPRISIATFFRAQNMMDSKRIYGPIPELMSEENSPAFRNFTLKEYMDHYNSKGLDGVSALAPFRV